MRGYLHSSAIVSECEKYRYLLTRTWDSTKPTMCFVMLNPSTADVKTDDPTIRRCVGFAKRFGCGKISVVNLFAFRATKPADMQKADDPIGPDCELWWEEAKQCSQYVIAAWGANDVGDRPLRALEFFGKMQCLGTTKTGAPRHPLMLPSDAQLSDWPKGEDE